MVIVILTALLSISYANTNTYTDEVLFCKPKVAYICQLSGCEKNSTPIIKIIVDLKSNRYYRCDADGCNTSDIDVILSGAFLYGSYGNGAGTIKIATLDLKAVDISENEFMDNASSMLMNITTYGTCTVKED